MRVQLLAPALLATGIGAALAADTVTTRGAPDLSGVRAKIAAGHYVAAVTELRPMLATYQHADVYNLLGYSLRKSGQTAEAFTFYQKALDFDPDHRGAREYLGALFVETGDLPKAREQLAALERLCPAGCEERADLEAAIAKANR